MTKHNSNNTSDFRSIDTGDAIKTSFPVQIFNEFRVFFAPEAYEEMKEHANLTSEVELGGVLIGDVCVDEQGKFLKICGTIPGEHANNYGAQVTFTHETWQHINEIKDKKYPDKRIVGWYHTHPGFGVFLSEMDKFIQDNFFNLPYQVAVVLETKDKVEGCFIWKDGKSVPIQRYWVGEKEIELFSGKVKTFDIADLPGQKLERDRSDEERPAAWSSQFMVFLIMVILFIFGFMTGQFFMIGELKKSLYEMLQSEVYSIMEYASLNTAASQDFEVIKNQLGEIRKQSGEAGKVNSEIDKLSIIIDNLKTTYDKHRTRFRKDLMEIQEHKENLSQKVKQNRLAGEELKSQLAMISIMRIAEILAKTEGKYEKLNYEDKCSIQLSLGLALHNDPALKIIIESKFPGLIKQIMPEMQQQRTRDYYNQTPGSFK